jgi:hypothetical protein
MAIREDAASRQWLMRRSEQGGVVLGLVLVTVVQMDGYLLSVSVDHIQEAFTSIDELACGRELGVVIWSLVPGNAGISGDQCTNTEDDGSLERREPSELVLGESFD